MKYLKKFEKNENKCYFFYIKEDILSLSTLNCCSKSERTFDIKFNDLAKNVKLLNLLNLYPNYNDTDKFASYIASLNFHEYKERYKILLTNPTLRLLISNTNTDLFIDVLECFEPNDIRVVAKKYNL